MIPSIDGLLLLWKKLLEAIKNQAWHSNIIDG